MPLNPWAGTGAIGDADPLHPDWDSVGEDDGQGVLKVSKIGIFADEVAVAVFAGNGIAFPQF